MSPKWCKALPGPRQELQFLYWESLDKEALAVAVPALHSLRPGTGVARVSVHLHQVHSAILLPSLFAAVVGDGAGVAETGGHQAGLLNAVSR